MSCNEHLRFKIKYCLKKGKTGQFLTDEKKTASTSDFVSERQQRRTALLSASTSIASQSEVHGEPRRYSIDGAKARWQSIQKPELQSHPVESLANKRKTYSDVLDDLNFERQMLPKDKYDLVEYKSYNNMSVLEVVEISFLGDSILLQTLRVLDQSHLNYRLVSNITTSYLQVS